jgi:uncharacterized secreted protein with C-terminal beta-propeller domain
MWWGGVLRNQLDITVYDLSGFPLKAERSVSLDGNLLGSRMIGEHLFVFSDYQLWRSDGALMLPGFSVDGARHQTSVADIGYLDESTQMSTVLTVMSLDVGSDQEPQLTRILSSGGQKIYVSQNNAYIGSTRAVAAPGGGSGTHVYKIPLRSSAADCASAGWIPGFLHNQFSLDEYKGYLRAATTVSTANGPTSSVTVLDADMKRVGSVDGLAPGESIYSARFVGEWLYLVTFKKLDPLFVIDLSDPAQPQVLGKLKIPGVSDYLHPIGKGLVVGVGRDAVDAGSFAWFQGLKVSLFDVSDVENPVELASFFIGDRGSWTPVRGDHKAFTWIAEWSVLVLPVHEFAINESWFPGGVPPSARGQEVWQGAYVIRATASDGLELLGKVTHHNEAADPECEQYLGRATESIERSFGLGDHLYTVSKEQVQAHSATTGTLVAAVPLSLTVPAPAVCPDFWVFSRSFD